MSPVWIAFGVRVFLGSVASMLTLSLCVAAKAGDNLPRRCHCDHAEQGRSCKPCRDGMIQNNREA